MERLVLLLGVKEGGIAPRLTLYLAWLGEEARDWAFPMVHQLRQRGVKVDTEGEERSLKSQMRRADKLRAIFVLIVGEEELRKGSGILRHMDTKKQSEVTLGKIDEDLPRQMETFLLEGSL
jgi:histidyl-tRNA synthetase